MLYYDIISHAQVWQELESLMIQSIGKQEGFPGGPVVTNPPSNEGNAASTPGWGTEIPHAMEQLIPPQPESPCVPGKDPT